MYALNQQAVYALKPLNECEAGQHVRIERIDGDHALLHRLLGLGLRRGIEVEVVQVRGRGVVIASGGTRIALGTGVAERLLVIPA